MRCRLEGRSCSLRRGSEIACYATRAALKELGYSLEELYSNEDDAALGNGGLGRLAACFLDSMATLDLPAWGYGIRYNYGIFRQVIRDGRQFEVPDYWLTFGNPWEIERVDVTYPVRFYGSVKEETQADGTKRKVWAGGEEVRAVAYDNPIPGFDTYNTINLRLWKAAPSAEFDLSSFNSGDYMKAVESRQRAETITHVLYPSDKTCVPVYTVDAATVQRGDIHVRFVCACVRMFAGTTARSCASSSSTSSCLRRCKTSCGASRRCRAPGLSSPRKTPSSSTTRTRPSASQSSCASSLTWRASRGTKHGRCGPHAWEGRDDGAWRSHCLVCCVQITTATFSYTNHTILPEALEKWDVGMMGHLLPRHLEIIYDINWIFLQNVQLRFPGDDARLRKVSIVEEGCVAAWTLL